MSAASFVKNPLHPWEKTAHRRLESLKGALLMPKQGADSILSSHSDTATYRR